VRTRSQFQLRLQLARLERKLAAVLSELQRGEHGDGDVTLDAEGRTDPARAEGYYLLGLLRSRRGDAAGARDAFVKALGAARGTQAIDEELRALQREPTKRGRRR
jgi:hypothetical protein